MSRDDRGERRLELIHSASRAKKQSVDRTGSESLPARSQVYRLSAVLERVERQLLHSFSKASPFLTSRVVATETPEFFVDELLAKSLVRGVKRMLMRSSWGRCLYAFEGGDGLVNTFTISRSFYIKVAARLRKLAGVDVSSPNPLKRGRFQLAFEGGEDVVRVELTSRLSDFGEFVTLDFVWQDG